jgi:two-component system, NarL family, invasion response regulator UvrY
MISVLIVDDHPIVRKGLRQLLGEEKTERFALIEEAGTAKEMFDILESTDIDVVLLDISLPGRNGLELLSDVKRIKPGLPVLMLSMYPEEQYAIQSLKLGASGYLIKSSAPDQLISAILKVAQGGIYLSSSIIDKIPGILSDKKDAPWYNELSVREMEVLRFLASGKTIGTIAKELSLSPKTIGTYRERILKKLKLKTTYDIISLAIKKGFTD